MTALLLAALACAVPARCPVCHGQRSLALTPPNLGQFDGEIGVTPGQPFKTHRWDVKHPRCPVCKGAGRLDTYKTRVAPPPPEAAEGREVCTVCWWSGAEPCRTCGQTGLVECPRCRSRKFGAPPGWLAEEKKTAGRTSQHKRLAVTACPACGGVGQTLCPDCQGKTARLCKRCKGEGSTPAKGK